MSIKYQTGIVLSGGGARGFAHLGVLRALNECGIYPQMISAVSAGSIVGALYADGKKPHDIFEIFSSLDIFKIFTVRRPMFGLLRAQGVEKVLEEQLSVRNIQELKIPLVISATNVAKARTDYFTEGPIVEAVLASSAIPMVLKPYYTRGEMYVDGGLMNNLPVEPLIDRCNQIIGVNVNPVNEEDKFKSFRNYTDRVLHLAIRANVKNNISLCNYYIEPPELMLFNLFKVSSAKEIYQIGYDYTRAYIEQNNLI